MAPKMKVLHKKRRKPLLKMMLQAIIQMAMCRPFREMRKTLTKGVMLRLVSDIFLYEPAKVVLGAWIKNKYLFV